MSFAAPVLSPWLLLVASLVSLGTIGLALAQRPWRALLADHALQHRWLAATLAVTLLWQLRAQAVDWLTLHLMFTALLTLVFKAPLALLSCLLANLAMVVLGRVAWPLLGVNLLVTGVVPVLVMVLVWRLVDRRLPDNLMVFLFVCGFFGTALATLAAGLSAVGLMALGASDPEVMHQALEYARFLPLLMPSEAFITGMLLSILLVYHPRWVATFNDHRYIDTK
ncbi:energy-coupling factor ABC transporter permease [Halomonas sp. EGI 63088]|uniref:Energy-coupling factor ABC transporter permease n=1 Tax=Halomonas flagellata TaxID=2920385 RepID=A0ABS9RUV1_9GAMM|nr:energy-coupling factor ABC transporter permease [Halomonas flagellata]MCH4563580.1 energy-coupling factor ABC transporter permease [Halomonas flagellata]